MMVAAISETTATNQTTRPPLLPSEKDHGIIHPNKPTKPKSRQVSSRYLSPSPSTSTSNSNSSSTPSRTRRPSSPLVSRSSITRSVSADRRRPIRPDLNNAGGEVSAATKLLVTSTRSLSVSFQGEAFSLPISKTKVTPSSPNLSIVRKGTPERKRTGTPLKGKVESGEGDHGENTKPKDQHRWPGRTRQANNTVLSKSLSLDCGIEKSKVIGSGNVIRLSLDLSNTGELLKRIQQNPDFTASDTDSVSSGSTSGVQESWLTGLRNGPRGIVASAKIWQETSSRMRRLQDPASPSSTSAGSKLVSLPKLGFSKKFSSDTSLSSPRTMGSPNKIRPVSPSKFMTSSSPLRGMASPRRDSVCGTINTSFSETRSVLSFAVDVRRRKVGENRIVDAHLLRLLYNRQLQWRFVNAWTEDTLLKQKHSIEKYLWNAWITISDLRDLVTKKRHRLQLLRQKLKLASILKEQMDFLEEWASLDKDHSISLLGAIEALKGSTLRLPVGGAIADLQSIKEALSSALVVMQAMGLSVCSLCLKVEEMNSMVTELANMSTKEIALLGICKDLLSIIAALKVKDCSLRAHMLQRSSV